MLRPEAPPEPLKPLATPVADYELPRELEDFDFGPQPIKGVSTTQVPSMLGVIANAAGAGFSAYAASTAGTSSFDYTKSSIDTSAFGGNLFTESSGNLSFTDALNMTP